LYIYLFNIDVIQFGLHPELEKGFSPFTIQWNTFMHS